MRKATGVTLLVIIVLCVAGYLVGRANSNTATTVRPATQSAPRAPTTHHSAPRVPRSARHHAEARPGRHAATYTVRAGDSLWAISAHVYHNPLRWHHLYEMNRHTLGGNPNLIYPGQVLRL